MGQNPTNKDKDSFNNKKNILNNQPNFVKNLLVWILFGSFIFLMYALFQENQAKESKIGRASCRERV